MADTKLSELSASGSLSSTDLLYIVQGTNSRKITLESLFNGIPVKVSFSNILGFTGTPETKTAAGTMGLTTAITHISSGASGWVLALPAATQGDVKVIVMTAHGGGDVSLSGSLNHTSVTFTKQGATATLLYSNGVWSVIGGTATVV